MLCQVGWRQRPQNATFQARIVTTHPRNWDTALVFDVEEQIINNNSKYSLKVQNRFKNKYNRRRIAPVDGNPPARGAQGLDQFFLVAVKHPPLVLQSMSRQSLCSTKHLASNSLWSEEARGHRGHKNPSADIPAGQSREKSLVLNHGSPGIQGFPLSPASFPALSPCTIQGFDGLPS